MMNISTSGKLLQFQKSLRSSGVLNVLGSALECYCKTGSLRMCC